MADSSLPLAMLKHRVAALSRFPPARGEGAAVPLGHAGIDRALGDGLERGRLHELFAAEAEDAGSAAGFAAALARRMGGDLLWLRQDSAQWQGRLHAPGLVEMGLDPARLILAVLPDPVALLRAAADVVRCPAVGVAVIELWKMPPVLDLTASRRLALAAEGSGVTVLMLRVAAQAVPSAAQTRWSVRALPSRALEANAPGHPAWEVELLRQRGRPAGERWQVEWCRDQASLRGWRDGWQDGEAAAPGALLPLPAGRPAEGDARRTA